MKMGFLLAPLATMLAMTEASADCSSTIENTSNSSTATLSANANNTCLVNSGTITLGVPNITLGTGVTNGSTNAQAILVDGWPTSFSGVTITNNGNISATYTGIGVDSGSSVSTLRNDGSIIIHSVTGSNLSPTGVFLDSGIINGIKVYSSIGIFNNYGIINVLGSGIGASGFSNSGGTVSNFTNYGTITVEDTGFGAAGIINQAGQTVSNLTNIGAISATNTAFPGINNRGRSQAYGIINQGVLPSLVNSDTGTISGGTSGVNNYSTGSITTLTNDGLIVGGDIGFENGGYVKTIINNGTIKGSGDVGLVTWSNPTISHLDSITNTGLIWGLSGGLSNNGSIANVTNSGQIIGYQSVNMDTGYGFYSGGFLGTLTNSGVVSGDLVGISFGVSENSQGATTNQLVNSGTISGRLGVGIFNDTPARIATLTNQGTISGGFFGIKNQGTITTLNNAQNGLTYTGVLPTNYNVILNSTTSFGRLVGTDLTGSAIFGLSNLSSWTPANYTFTGVLKGLTASNVNSSSLTGAFNGYEWSLFLEPGSSNVWDLKLIQICPFPLTQSAGASCISGNSIQTPQAGDVVNGGTIIISSSGFTNDVIMSSVTNSGTITGAGAIRNLGTITALSNSGTMSYVSDKSQYWMLDLIVNEKTVGLVNNTGQMSSDWKLIGNSGSINSINNSGSMNSYAANVSNYINGAQIGSIGSLTNSGSITSGVGGVLAQNSDFAAIQNSGVISTLTNSGTILGGTDGISNDTLGRLTTLTNTGSIVGGTGSYGINNLGAITTLNNAQNGLTYTGVLPTNYNVILNSTTSFGRLVGTNVSGSAIFGLSNLSSWTPANYTFTGILSGLSTLNIASTSLTGNLGGYKWSLQLENGSSTIWDLIFRASVIGAGSTSSISNGLGSAPITVAGGTLEATENSTITAPVTLTGSSDSRINSSGKSSVFAGAITSSGSGKLELSDSTGSGAVTLNSPNNVIAGGVALTSGTLAVGDGSNPNARLQADVALSPASTLKGHGTIVGLISNNGGTVRPGGSIGTLAVDGSYNQSTSSTLSIEISPTQNSLLSVYGAFGKANLGGTLDIVATAGTYAPKKYTMVTTTGGVVGSFSNVTNNLSSFSNLYSAVSYDAQNVYFTIYGFTLADTQASIVQTHSRLVNLFDYQSMMLSNSLGADCSIFDKNGGCVSISGNYSSAVAPSNPATSESGILTLAFKLNDNFRIGAYVDQTVSAQTLYGIKISNTLPTFGIFGVWAPTPGNAGFSVRVSAGYSMKDLKIARSTVGTSEAGIGSSGLATKGARTVIGYDVPITDGLTIAPYLGARYERQDLGSYTEAASATVAAPLTYASLVVDRAAVIGGGRLSGKIGQSFGLFADLGVEHDFLPIGGALTASGVTGLTSVTSSLGGSKVRPIGSVGAYYDLAKNQRISLSANYRKEAFQSSGSASTMLTYALGF